MNAFPLHPPTTVTLRCSRRVSDSLLTFRSYSRFLWFHQYTGLCNTSFSDISLKYHETFPCVLFRSLVLRNFGRIRDCLTTFWFMVVMHRVAPSSFMFLQHPSRYPRRIARRISPEVIVFRRCGGICLFMDILTTFRVHWHFNVVLLLPTKMPMRHCLRICLFVGSFTTLWKNWSFVSLSSFTTF